MSEEIKCRLRQAGYETFVEARPRYRGCSLWSSLVYVRKGTFKGVATVTNDSREMEHIRRIAQVQDGIRHIAKIREIIGHIIVYDEAPGELVWESEQRPPVTAFDRMGQEFLSDLRRTNLVHADIRPWNVFFEPKTQSFTFIDWGFSFFIGDQIDHLRCHIQSRGHALSDGFSISQKDLEFNVQILQGTTTPETAWRHSSAEFEWRPPWCHSLA